MVNDSRRAGATLRKPLPLAGPLIYIYVVVAFGTLAVLALLAIVSPSLAPQAAWWHTVIVAAFAVLLPLRLRSAEKGRRGAIRAVGLIAAVIFLVNVIEALLPGFVPLWMQVTMIVVGLLMIGVVADVIRWALRNDDRGR